MNQGPGGFLEKKKKTRDEKYDASVPSVATQPSALLFVFFVLFFLTVSYLASISAPLVKFSESNINSYSLFYTTQDWPPPEAEFLVPMKVVTVFCSLEVATFSEP